MNRHPLNVGRVKLGSWPATGRRLVLSLATLTSAVGLAVLVPAAPSAAAASSTTFTYTGSEQTYTVPPGVTTVTVHAVGAPGAAGVDVTATPGAGGDGASVTATVAVTPGETLYVEVGGPGETPTFDTLNSTCSGTPAAFNGGGSSPCGGGGGGASDVRTCSTTDPTCANLSPDTRLVVAGGGGGGGGNAGTGTAGAGGQGGDTTVAGAGNGGNGPVAAGGNGGLGAPPGGGGSGSGCAGNPGSRGQGASSPSCANQGDGGAGGGGYDGGGSGGEANGVPSGGGGGAGSSFWVPGAIDPSMSFDPPDVPIVTITPGPMGSGSQVHAVVQVETSPSYAGDPVQISSPPLTGSCASPVIFATLQGGSTINPTMAINSITAVLDDDGNVTVVVDSSGCAPGPDLIEADLTVAPYLSATSVLDVEPPQVTTEGVTADPSTEVETGNSPASGDSDVYTVFYVETNPVYAEQPVEISSPGLDNRCGGGYRWEPAGGPAVTEATASAPVIATLDDDGNAAFVFKGASCAAGASTVIADVLSGSHPTYTTTFTISAPVDTLATIKMGKISAKAKKSGHHRRHPGGSGTGGATGSGDPAITVTASPSSPVETSASPFTGPTATATSPTASSIVIGNTDTDAVTVTGEGAFGSPTGTVSFYACGPTASATPCTSQANEVGSPAALTSGAGDTASATSAAFTPTSPGTWCFAGYYSGGPDYAPSADTSADECYTVLQAPTSTVSTPDSVYSGPTVVGANNYDIVTVTGYGGGSAPYPTGTVSFYACYGGPCTSTSGSPFSTVSVNAVSPEYNPFTVVSGGFATNQLGQWCFAAVYSGDSNYTGSSDESTDECYMVVQAATSTASTPDSVYTGSIEVGDNNYDLAYVTGYGGGSAPYPTGTVDFYTCPVNVDPCTPTDWTLLSTESLSDPNNYNPSQPVTSAGYAPSSAGTWCFAAVYSGDANYTGSSDESTDECYTAYSPSP